MMTDDQGKAVNDEQQARAKDWRPATTSPQSGTAARLECFGNVGLSWPGSALFALPQTPML